MVRIAQAWDRARVAAELLLVMLFLTWTGGFAGARMAAPGDFTISGIHYTLAGDGRGIAAVDFAIDPADTGPLWIWFSDANGPVGATPYYSESGGDCRRTGNQVHCTVDVPVQPPTQLNVLVEAPQPAGGGGAPVPPPAPVVASLPPPTGGPAPANAEIWGMVRFLGGGPATGAQVSLDSGPGTGLSAAGTFRFTGLAQGSHTVGAALAGYQVVQVLVDGRAVSGSQATVDLAQGNQRVEVDFVLARSGRQVTAPQPPPQAGPGGGLAFTGGNFDAFVLGGLLLMLASAALSARRFLRRREEAREVAASGDGGS
ncbi:MAG: carboxypeptidase-like regulatory domain-containing protein [Firmicutes bacterium]|nr:carboxypeptidase-like regulatory domain-containing protein [Bacillota bacterium]